MSDEIYFMRSKERGSGFVVFNRIEVGAYFMEDLLKDEVSQGFDNEDHEYQSC